VLEAFSAFIAVLYGVGFRPDFAINAVWIHVKGRL
jgi:hypothetical protein